MKEEQTKIQKQLEDSQQLVAEKEKQVAELRSNLEDMKKATETVRDLQREIKSLKVISRFEYLLKKIIVLINRLCRMI